MTEIVAKNTSYTRVKITDLSRPLNPGEAVPDYLTIGNQYSFNTHPDGKDSIEVDPIDRTPIEADTREEYERKFEQRRKENERRMKKHLEKQKTNNKQEK